MEHTSEALAADGRVEPPAMLLDADEASVEPAAHMSGAIWQQPHYYVSWVRTRSDAKVLAKELAAHFGTAKAPKGRSKQRGAPAVAPGRSRRHGGYGIG